MMTAVLRLQSRSHSFALATVLVLIGIRLPLVAAAEVWIEGEAASVARSAGFKLQVQHGPNSVLSDGRWITMSVEGGKVERAVPETGVDLVYNVPVSAAGNYRAWMHLGFETARTPFAWRFDGDDWQKVGPDAPTVDVREIGVWAPVAWLDLGAMALNAGEHRLELRVSRPEKDKDGKFPALLFGCDAICLSTASFHPEGTIHPADRTWQTQADRAAAAHVFDIPTPANAAQTAVSLAGTWQYAGDDEPVVKNRLEPVKTISDPAKLNWHALTVPGDRNEQLPGETYIHRYYLRTRVHVPAALAGRSFVLHVPGMSVVASVFVNGRYCGGTKNCWAVWDCDLTKAVRPGEVNEVVVALKDAFYALAGDKHPDRLDYIPYSFWHFNTTHQLLLPILTGEKPYPTGFVLGPPTLVVAGETYTADVFAIPSVKHKTLGLEIALHNPTDRGMTVNLTNEIVPVSGGPAEKTFASRQVRIPAGEEVVAKLSEDWANPKLWWPDDPQQYNVVTRLSVAGKAIDERKTKFGFREWSYDGFQFKLNGVPWYGFAEASHEQRIDVMKRRGENMTRIWWQDPQTETFQDDCDAKGMVVRRTGTFDGQGVGGFFDLKRDALWDNYREQMTAWIKGLRNHPSIFLWSIENEITFINGHVTGNDALTTPQIRKSAQLFKKVDPTRASMVDGGNALLDESLEVYGGHYMEPRINTFPEGCYDKAGMAHRQVWPITKAKPIIWGEAAWGGDEGPTQATVGGERAFLGKGEARPATLLSLKMLSEGYRWSGISANFWTGETLPPDYKPWQPVAVLCRQWDWTFASGTEVTRTLGIFNNMRIDDPITLTWTLSIAGRKVAEDTKLHSIPAGGDDKFEITLPMPRVTARQEGTLTLTLARHGKTVFDDAKQVSVLPPAKSLLSDDRLPTAGSVGLYDPQGKIGSFLADAGLMLTPVTRLSEIPGNVKTLVIGPDALDPVTAASSRLSAWASTGRAVIVLEQTNPMRFQGLPGEMATDVNQGCIAFAEDPEGPLFIGLAQKDLFCWGGENWLYRDAYVKPVSGGKSIIQCDLKLADSALVEMQAGQGVLLLSQLLIGEKLHSSAAAQYLLLNMVRYADSYKLVSAPATAVVEGNPPLAKALDTIGLKYARFRDPLAAIAVPGSVAVIDASPANLKTLAANLPKVKAFTEAGGWIIFNNLGPDGLADYNRLVGVDHVIRPLQAEKVTWPAVRNPITSGLPTSNIVLGTGKRIMWFAPPEWPDPNGYSYVVDLDEVAPFATSSYYKWQNAVNNYTQADGAWQLIENLEPQRAVLPIKLARPERLLQFTWVSDNNYQGTTKIELTINGKEYLFDTRPDGDPQTFDIPDRPTASALTLEVVDWTHDAKKNTRDGRELVGIDNIYIKVARSEEYKKRVKPMLNIGAMVQYPQGKGGIILCNVKFRDSEENPANFVKKQTVLATLLRNLHASFAGGKTIIAGGSLEFDPIDISRQCNQYRGERGWFGDKAHTFDALPQGKQFMAGVTYDIYHFSTSLVPEAIMLGGNRIPGRLGDAVIGIPVNRKADALFFLQAARIDKHRNAKEAKAGKQYEMAAYVIHYSDGQSARVPVYAEISVENYRQEAPAALPGAQIGWAKSYGDGTSAVAYSMQWNNPRPEAEITRIDLVYGKDRRGVPALLAITTARAR
jgi:beta-galactosidase